MSGLIIETAVRPNRKARLAHRARAGSPFPNMQQRQRGIPQAIGCQVAPGPVGPMLAIGLDGGGHIPLPLTPDQARQIGIALISCAAQMEILKKMASDQADGQPVPTNPDLEELLAEAQAHTAGPVGLKGDEDVDDDDDLDDPNDIEGLDLDPCDPCQAVQFNTFDINGQPCYEPPTD